METIIMMIVFGYTTINNKSGCVRARTKEDAIALLKFLNIIGEIK
jgi:hypothetical protein